MFHAPNSSSLPDMAPRTRNAAPSQRRTLDAIRIDAIRIGSEGGSMTIITIASSKGGPGKTTLTELLVGSLASDGVNVAALDADPTGGLSRWAGRLYEGPPFTCHHEADEARLAHLIHRVAQEAEVVVVDTAGFGNRAATVAMTAADAVLIPMVPGEGDVTEAARTVELVAGVASAARRDIPSRVVLNRVRSSTALSKHAAAEAASLPTLSSSLSDLVAYGEMGFSGRMPTGKAATEVAALVAELRNLGWLPSAFNITSSVKTKYVMTREVPH
jgi:chromosome partitioning protein